MDSALRPRDIQARIRGGETAESVAEAAGVPVEKIMPYCSPVLAERAHVAQTALRASVRRGTGPGGARTLGESVDRFLAAHGLREDDVAWDAWRRADGRWALTAEVEAGDRPHRAEFTLDVAGRYVVAGNDDARLLTGELSPGEPDAPSRGLTALAGGYADVPFAPDNLGDDALELVRDPRPTRPAPQPAAPDPAVLPEADPVAATGPHPDEQPDEQPDEATIEVAADPAESAVDEGRVAESPVEGSPVEESPVDDQPELDLGVPEQPPSDDAAAAEAGSDAAPDPKPKRTRKGRASVPSWDEIMFGGGPQD